MGILATTAEVWASVGTTIATVLLLVPGVVYAWYLLENWIGDDDSYTKVIASLENEVPTTHGRLATPSPAPHSRTRFPQT
jgi:hypothetical protein